MVSKTDVCIVGLGWLGQALYRHLESKGHSVMGTRTAVSGVETMRREGMNAHRLELNPTPQDEHWRDWLNCRVLVINIPPGRKDPDMETRYPLQIKALLEMAVSTDVEQVIFVSSTSVFGAATGEVDDTTPVQPNTASGWALAECEHMLKNDWNGKYAVVRFGGLYGPERHPGRFFSGRSGIPNGDASVNFIHREDCVGVTEFLIENAPRSAVINACAPNHPPKKDFYHRAAIHADHTPPQFLPGGAEEKRVRCTWLEKEGYVFRRGGLEL